MSHADYLRELLRPLRVYELTGTANGGELEAVGEALDALLDQVVEGKLPNDRELLLLYVKEKLL